jgi:hypothetical protein
VRSPSQQKRLRGLAMHKRESKRMKDSKLKRRIAEATVGAVVGGVIAGPVGALAGGIVGHQIASHTGGPEEQEAPATQSGTAVGESSDSAPHPPEQTP